MSDCCPYEMDFSEFQEVCELMPKRLLVTGILVKWMQNKFSDEDKIVSEFLKEAIWTSNIETTAILIDTVFRYDPAQTETRPCIAVKPGTITVVRRGIDDRMMVNQPNPNCDTNEIKPTKYNTFLQGSATLFCIAGNSAEVEILSDEVLKEMIQFGPTARKEFGFMRFVAHELGEPSILEEATENFVVPVVVSYVMQDIWQICPTEFAEE